jgi:hypothetical protein
VAVAEVEVAEEMVDQTAFSVDQLERHTELVVAEAVWIMEVHHKDLQEVLVLQVS